MEFSHQLTAVARVLIKKPLRSVDVHVHRTSSQNFQHWMSVVNIVTMNELKLKGSGLGLSLYDSFIKALAEVGENFVVKKEMLKDRNGLSGGMLGSAAIARSKFELLERDAFLYHYRNQEPFLSMEQTTSSDSGERILIYRMNSAVDSVHCFFATNERCANGVGECLWLGLGAHADEATARDKAVGEFSAMRIDHLRRPGWCQQLSENMSLVSRLPDFHHVHSRDPRNKEIIKRICAVETCGKRDRRMNQMNLENAWAVKKMPSPIRLIKYFQVSNPLLSALEFGNPELTAPHSNEGPLYHPVW